jgi:hypothetical protein
MHDIGRRRIEMENREHWLEKLHAAIVPFESFLAEVESQGHSDKKKITRCTAAYAPTFGDVRKLVALIPVSYVAEARK